jgi:hypothetical protein
MKDKRSKFFAVAAMTLVQLDIKFEYSSLYLKSERFEMSLDRTDKSKIWIEKSDDGEWISFVMFDQFKSWLNKNIK